MQPQTLNDVFKPAIEKEQLWEKYGQTKSVDIRNQLIVSYSPLVKRIAGKTVGSYQYFNYFDDIINEGIIALMDAIEKFDTSKNVKFETFASIKIKGAMIDFIRKQDCFPRRIKKLSKTLSDAESTLCNKLGRNPTQEELAYQVGATVKELEKMQLEVYALNMYSFEQVVYETNSENTIQTFFSSMKDSPEQRLAQQEMNDVLAKAIDNLKENEKIIVALHYKEQLRIKDIAAILKISDSRVSQIHSTAIKKLKEALLQYNNI